MHTLDVYGESMQTTIRIDNDVLEMLEEQKKREQFKSYNEVVKKLLLKEELSMYGADKKLKKWEEKVDRAEFH